MKKYFNYVFILLIMIIIPVSVSAGSVSMYMGGNGSVQQGNTITVSIGLSSASPNLQAYGGVISYSSNLEFQGCSSSSSLSYSKGQGGKFAFTDWSGVGISSGTVGTCTFKALSPGTGNVSVTSSEAVDTTGAKVSANISKSFSITEPPSGDNNLASLSVSGCSIGFSAGNTSYSCNVETDVTSVNVSASAAHGRASVSGTGNRGLNYGNNNIDVTVRAENGATKTYTIRVNRKDNRSKENALASLTCSNCTLSPAFSSGTTNYKTDVDFSVSSLSLKYTAKDTKASVRVSNNSLVAEETTNVTITVTAENGSTKTYTIAASRGKDPNKVLNTDNNLVSLTVDQGILSPAFSADQTNYGLYLPYEISKVNFAYEVSDKRYGVVSFNGPEELGVGNNVYTISVKAEDGKEKVYTITVVRAKSLVGDASTNALLASLTLKNGTLTQGFESGVHLYYYNQKSKKDVVVDAIAQDKEAVVTYLEAGMGVYAVLVTAPSGNSSIYIMIPEEKQNAIIFIILAAIALLLGIIFIIVKAIKKKKNNNHEDKKEKKEKDNKKEKKTKKSKREEEE